MKHKLLVAAAVLGVVVLIGFKLLRPVPPMTAERPGPAAPPAQSVRVPAPRLPVTAAAAEPATVETNSEANAMALLTRLFGTNGLPGLKPEQLEAYLKENHRSAESLLVAARTTGDKTFLREAMEKYPNDPRVAFDAFFRNGPYDSTKPASEERRKWLDVLQQNDSKNALGDYLSARDHFRSGQTELALRELQSASGKSEFQDYSLDFLQSAEEAYRAGGYSEASAKYAATYELPLPTLSELKQLGQNAVDLAKQYQQAGDTASAQAVLQLGLNLGERFNGPGQFPLINTLVGIAIEKNLLAAMDPNSAYGNSGSTVQNRIDALNQQRTDIKTLVKQSDAILPTMSDQDLIGFFDRTRMFGEAAAMRWAVGKYGQH
jgi:hypothetical protein